MLDASVALSAIFPDEILNPNALALRNERYHSIRLRMSQKKILAPSLETLVYSLFDALPVQMIHDPNVLTYARQLAVGFDRNRIYDAIYIALAQLHGLEFWAGDERLYNVVAGKDAPKGQALSLVHFLGYFTP